MAVLISITYICTKALHSMLSSADCRAASTVIPLLPKATFTLSIQHNLGLSRTRAPLTSAIDAFLARLCSSILSTCSTNHLNTLWSTLFANSLSIPALLRISSYLLYPVPTVSTPTVLLKYFISSTFTSLSLHFSYPMSLPHTMLILQLHLHRHFFAFIHNPLLPCTLYSD